MNVIYFLQQHDDGRRRPVVVPVQDPQPPGRPRDRRALRAALALLQAAAVERGLPSPVASPGGRRRTHTDGGGGASTAGGG